MFYQNPKTSLGTSRDGSDLYVVQTNHRIYENNLRCAKNLSPESRRRFRIIVHCYTLSDCIIACLMGLQEIYEDYSGEIVLKAKII